MTGTWGKVVDGFVTTRDGEAVDEGDRVETPIGDAKAPDEVVDVGDVFLVGFWG